MKYLKQLDDEISLKLLSEKLVVLLSILSGQTEETLKVLNVEHMVLEDSKCTFFIKRLLKTTRKNFHQPPVEIRSNPCNTKICVIKTLHDYIGKSKNLRTTAELIISYKKPHVSISTSTIERWFKNI